MFFLMLIKIAINPKFIEKHLSELPEKSRKSYETLLDEKDLAKNIAKLIKVMTLS